MTLRPLSIVFRKEIVDGIRDRRSIYSVVFSVVVGPLLIGFMFTRLAERQKSANEVEIPVVGAQHAPALIDWLRQQDGVTIVEGPQDAEHAVREQERDLVLIIPEEYGEKFNAARPAEVRLVADGSRDTARPKVQRTRALLERYSREIAMLRLIARGVSPMIATPLGVKDVEVSSAQQRAARVLAFVPMLIVINAFVGGMQIATDSTAGERERGSLESLLANPVAREAIVGGKWLAAVVFAMATILFTAALCVGVMQRVPLQELGVRFRFGPDTLAAALAAGLPIAFLASGLQVFIASFARSFKEAQSYLGMLILVPTLPAVLTVVYPVANQWWLAPIPILGQHLLLNDILGGKQPGALPFVLAGLSAIALGLVMVYLTTRLFRKEQVIFGR